MDRLRPRATPADAPLRSAPPRTRPRPALEAAALRRWSSSPARAGSWLAPGEIAPGAGHPGGARHRRGRRRGERAQLLRGARLDGRMRRTRDRPLPAGRLEPVVALALGVLVPVFAIPRARARREPAHRAAGAASRSSRYVARLHAAEAALDARPLRRERSRVPSRRHGLDGGHRPARRRCAGRSSPCSWPGSSPTSSRSRSTSPDDYGRAGLPVFALVHGEPVTRRAILARPPPGGRLRSSPSRWGWRVGPTRPPPALLGAGLPGTPLLGLRGRARWARSFFLSTLAYLTAAVRGAGPAPVSCP